jgi:hypothetical protein
LAANVAGGFAGEPEGEGGELVGAAGALHGDEAHGLVRLGRAIAVATKTRTTISHK